MTMSHPPVTPPWTHTGSSGPTADQTIARFGAGKLTGRPIGATVQGQTVGSTCMAAIKYKTFTLSPCPHRLIDTRDWLVGVVITKQNGSGSATREKRFFSNKVFNEKSNANFHAIQFGKEIIDGKHANLSVSNL
jgi:hypothetical protein